MTIADLIDLNFLQNFQDAFAKALGISCVMIDQEGRHVTKPSRFTDFCMTYTRGCSAGMARCVRSDLQGAKESQETGKPAIYTCENGLIDFATPILLEGVQIGAILGGQVLSEMPEPEKYISIAKEIGVDPTTYLQALQKVPIVPKETIIDAANLLSLIATQISKMGYQKNTMNQLANALHDNLLHIVASSQELAASASEVNHTQQMLNEEIVHVSASSMQITAILEAIKRIVEDINLLGFNAAIEAARVGTIGSGFGVIAKEIRKLSAQSKITLNQIAIFTENIQTNVLHTVTMGNTTLETTLEQAEAIHGIMEAIEELSELAEKLNEVTEDSVVL